MSEMPPLPGALADLKTFLRVSVTDEEALLAGLIRAAAELCEAFVGRVLIERAIEEAAAAASGPVRLGAGPVRSIESVAILDDAGAATPLDGEDFTAEIDADGGGRVKLRVATGAGRVRIRYRAGMAPDWDSVPEMLRHGVIRLAAQYYLRRGETKDAEVPAAVTALWRPWRRLPFGAGPRGH